MDVREGKFAGDNPIAIARGWLTEAEASEPNDANACALATVDGSGMPNVRMVLLKDIDIAGFVFFTNYQSAKAREIDGAGKAALVLHWKSLRRQIRVRGLTRKEDGPLADDYFRSRSLQSRLGAWASRQSSPLSSRAYLMAAVAKVAARKGINPERPPFWGGYRIVPLEIEFWSDGEFRLHDRFRWQRDGPEDPWTVERLNP
jgi:pyridoxamine 5'-phosphate oxidase